MLSELTWLSEDQRRGVEGTVYLRVDVDSHAGTRIGVPALLALMAREQIRGTFFLSLGPDRWGRAVFWVFTRPGFLTKMLRTRAVSMYGLSTCLRGTLLPSINISKSLPNVLASIAAEGHEVGAHCWDHVAWQSQLTRLTSEQIREHVATTVEAFRGIFGRAPAMWASPGWVNTPAALAVLDSSGFSWMSNSRATGPFVPIVGGMELNTVEVPTTVPTLDEELGRDGVDESSYPEHLARQMEATPIKVLTIHAEAEGRKYLPLFERCLQTFRARGWSVTALGELARIAQKRRAHLPRRRIEFQEIPGRSGRVTVALRTSPTPASHCT